MGVDRAIGAGVLQDHDLAVGPEATAVDHAAGLGRVDRRPVRRAEVDAFVGPVAAQAEAGGEAALDGPAESQRAVVAGDAVARTHGPVPAHRG